MFLRSISPFLTTALAATVATFCPASAHLCKALADHAHNLALRVFDEGLKSTEVVQAFDFMSHWAQPVDDHGGDRSWTWLGQALRIGSEIRLDLPFGDEQMAFYHAAANLTPEDVERLAKDRAVTWTLLFCGELAMAVQTGRVHSLASLKITSSLLQSRDPPEQNDPLYSLYANVALQKLYANALSLAVGHREAQDNSDDVRDSFIASWASDFELWPKTWPHVNSFVTVNYINDQIILYSMALQLPGNVQPILEKCASLALSSARRVAAWADSEDQSILYASNFSITTIAYAATLLLKLSALPGFRGVEARSTILEHCQRVSLVLHRIGQTRVNGTSFASLHAARIDVLIATSTASGTTTPLLATPSQNSFANLPSVDQEFSLFFDTPPLGDEMLTDDFVENLMRDPMFHWDLPPWEGDMPTW
ncbi:Zn(2)-C6 fungal-type transcription factor [Pseudohyphozyma bogoriensis]|nr:Zn(2)-C6 fungal-type transcription factor [Pseudohyphozyma bogoriensis]